MALAAEIHTAEYVRGLFMYRINSLPGRMTLLATAAIALFLTAVEAQPPLPTTTPAPTAAPVPTATPKPPLGSVPAGPAAAPQSSPVSTAPAATAPQASPVPTAAATATPEIRLVSPKVTYPKKGENHYHLTIVGSNLGRKTNTEQISLYVDDNIVDPVEWKAPGTDRQKAYGEVRQDDSRIDVSLPWPKYSGALKLKVGVGDKVSDAFDIIVSKIESPLKAPWLAAAVTLAVLALPLFLVSRNKGNVYKVADKQYGVLAAFFLDKEIDTYSLSKFQFYVWTSVAIFGYVYLALVESLVQGKAVFPEIPENLPGIILISAATGALAAGISTAKGPKGAGDIHPSLGDFITAGGLVVAERFQFFVWTALGAVTFLFFTLTGDPATLHDLPKIPDSFLQIMGISSLGYLGGKLARKPGPVIDDIQADPATATALAMSNTLTLTISGQKLSHAAGLRIDDTDVPVGTPGAGVTTPYATRQDGAVKEEQGDFYKKLIFQVGNPDAKWKTAAEHKVTIINDDGKAASWNYKIT